MSNRDPSRVSLGIPDHGLLSCYPTPNIYQIVELTMTTVSGKTTGSSPILSIRILQKCSRIFMLLRSKVTE